MHFSKEVFAQICEPAARIISIGPKLQTSRTEPDHRARRGFYTGRTEESQAMMGQRRFGEQRPVRKSDGWRRPRECCCLGKCPGERKFIDPEASDQSILLSWEHYSCRGREYLCNRYFAKGIYPKLEPFCNLKWAKELQSSPDREDLEGVGQCLRII